MSEISIPTSRGVTLAADLVVPVDASNRAVIFAHSFLLDRHGLGWFDAFAKSYRAAGYSTLQLDFSGCGNSSDDVISLENQIEDLRQLAAGCLNAVLTNRCCMQMGRVPW